MAKGSWNYNKKLLVVFFLFYFLVLFNSVFSQSQNTVYSWGDNANGQLGMGYSSIPKSPVQVGVDSNWVKVCIIDDKVFGIKTDNTLWYYDTILKQIGNDKTWLNLFSNNKSAFAIKFDGTLWSWGDNKSGQLGLGNIVNTAFPMQVGYDNDWVEIFISDINTFGLKTDGTLWSWGDNAQGQLGLGNKNSYFTPQKVNNDIWNQIINNGYNVLALRNDQSLWAWGLNSNGVLGLGNSLSFQSPQRVGDQYNWYKIYSNGSSAFGIKTDSSLWSWGLNQYGKLGLGNLISVNSPTRVGLDKNWSKIFISIDYIFGLKSDGSLWEWGKMTLYPVRNTKDSNWMDFYYIENFKYGGFRYSYFVIKNNGSLWSWGVNYDGNLGIGNSISSTNSPKQIDIKSKWKMVSCNSDFNIGLKSNGTLWVWGKFNYIRLGINPFPINFDKPQKIINLKNIKYISTSNHTLAIHNNGTLWSWGSNDSGQLGLSDEIERSLPKQLGFDSTWIAVSAGGTHSLGLKSNGTIWSWGGNYFSPLGLNITGDTIINHPIQVGKDTDWVQISSSYNGSFAIKRNGTLWGWGLTFLGSYGFKNNSQIQIGTESSWKLVSASYYPWMSNSNIIFAAIKKDNTLWINKRVYLKKNKFDQAGIEKDWESVAVGWNKIIAKKLDGSIWIISDTSISQIGNEKNWKKVEASLNSFYAIKNDSSLWEISSNGLIKGEIGSNKKWINISSKYNYAIAIEYEFNSAAKIDKLLKNEVILFPNPVNEIINLDFKNRHGDIKFNISDTNGRIILGGITHGIINVKDLKSGIYFLEIDGMAFKFVRL